MTGAATDSTVTLLLSQPCCMTATLVVEMSLTAPLASPWLSKIRETKTTTEPATA